MKRCCKILFICLFALLQSVAPLAHAHVNGDHDYGSVHAVELEHALFGQLDLSQPSVSTTNSPSIGMPHELQREISFDLGSRAACLTPSLPPVASPLLHPLGKLPRSSSNIRPSPYETPLSHAPPALA